MGSWSRDGNRGRWGSGPVEVVVYDVDLSTDFLVTRPTVHRTGLVSCITICVCVCARAGFWFATTLILEL